MKIHLDRLMELEFLLAHRGRQGQTYTYELLYRGEDAEGRAKLLGLIDCASLQAPAANIPESEGMTGTSRGGEATSRGEGIHFSAPSRGVLGPFSAPLRGGEMAFGSSDDEGLALVGVHEPQKRGTVLPLAPVLSYPQVHGAGTR